MGLVTLTILLLLLGLDYGGGVGGGVAGGGGYLFGKKKGFWSALNCWLM